ncbi:extracellular catalytic domain type 1 short-chain-length polyhydroxyalkanoate depolymerase [Marichromatium bheemlicum]|uniref:PHB depolymerase family esterase n=1 Tax=Marichromatium bheemlicum TaxID=365339 RepID=A0ABX1I882_9GAMM|nr:PHB depolymerase family esterase [Marichromatium bheemlicum]NKN33722.1 PHB depolymerase family esterase [Marichromatium bheemlicum]
MSDSFKSAMQEAARLTQAGRVAEATVLVQRAMGLVGDDAPRVIEAESQRVERTPTTAVAGRWIENTFANAAGARRYRLYLPECADGLVVMLHGCGQGPEDFAAGTRMHQYAAAEGLATLYPAQSVEANGASCWNWYEPADQGRDRGECAILAGMTEAVMMAHGLDDRRTYVAGLSAGGAMAATLAAAYPERYVALGVHSGLPAGCAHDLISAMTVMRQGASPPVHGPVSACPSIIFHGDRDTRVSPANALALIAQARAGVMTGSVEIERGRAAAGLAFSRTRYPATGERAEAELWLVHGAGHGWSGGVAGASYTEPRGPDASVEMLRFFLAHAR